MDKASLLGDAISYINEIRFNMQALELDEGLLAQIKELKKDPRPPDQDHKFVNGSHAQCHSVEIEVTILGPDAMIRLQCLKRNHPAAILMAALRELELEVFYASVSVVKELMFQ